MPGVRHRALRPSSTLAVALAVLAVNLWQSPGRATFDTKLDLLINPGDFLQRSLSMWNSGAAFGGVQNQAYGFLFPMGPWFWLCDALGLPVWVSERSWSSLLLIVAYAGMRRLARAWGLDGGAAMVAGLAYMLAPRMLTTVGVLSGEVVPAAVLPWTMLPLLLHLRGRVGAGRAALFSAATIPFMGGHNATEVLASLAAPAVLLLLAEGGARWRLGAGWLGLVALASVWWLVPLLLLGRYSPPFLDYIESASATTSNIGWLAALRGTTHWVAWLGDGLTGWTAGFDLVSSPFLLVATTATAAIGLVGLLSRHVAQRRALLGCLALGLLVMTLGSADIAGSPWRDSWRALLDGPLAPFRNIHKFDPVVRLPLALGLGFAVSAAAARMDSWRHRAPGMSRVHARASTAVVGLVGCLLIATAQPALAGHLRDADPYDAVPTYWQHAAEYLRKLPHDSRVLVVPGSSFAVQTWGRTQDEVLQALDVVPMTVRNQIPISSPGLIRTLDTVEDALVGGRPSPGFSLLLQRIGITHLVVRNDLDPAHSDAPSPSSVHAVLGGSPDLRRVRAFGNAGNGFPGVEVFAVGGGGSALTVTPLDEAVRLTGGPDALMSALGTGALAPETATVTLRRAGPRLIADTYRRVERTFGRVHQAVTAVMTRMEPFHLDRPVHDYDLPGEPQTYAGYRKLTAVTASTSSGYANTFGAVQPGHGPQAAVDGQVFTAWRSGPFGDPLGQWIQLDLEEPRHLPNVSLVFDPRLGADVSRVRIDVDSGSVSAAIDAAGRSDLVALPEGTTRRLRVTVVGVRDDASRPVVLAELGASGLEPVRRLDVPATLGPQDTLLLTSTPAARICLPQPNGADCDAGRTVAPAENGTLHRRIEVDAGGRWVLSGSVVAGTGNDVARLFDPLSRRLVRVVGSSSYGGDAGAGAWHALDGDPGTTWISGVGDDSPVLDLRWGPRRTITRIHVATFAGRAPSTVQVEGGGRTQTVRLGPTGLGLISPIRTRHLRLRFTGPDGADVPGPISVAELRIEGLEGLVHHPDPDTPTGTPCGFGPQVVVAGHPVPTRVVGTLGEVERGQPLRLESCERSIAMAAGTADVSARAAGGFVVTVLTLRPEAASEPEPSSGSAHLGNTSDDERSIRVRTVATSILALPQDVNDGWHATLDGTSLQAVTVDGWRQGWIVPADSDGTIHLTFGPQRWYVGGLLLGAVLVALLWSFALLLGLRQRGTSGSQVRASSGPRVSAAITLLLRGRSRYVVAAGLATLVAVLVSPPLALGIFLGSTPQMTRPRARWLAAALVAVAAANAALTVGDSLRSPAVADVVVAVALGAVTAVGWRDVTPPSGPHEEVGA